MVLFVLGGGDDGQPGEQGVVDGAVGPFADVYAGGVEAPWLYAVVDTCHLHAGMTHKQQAIDRTKPLNAKPGRYRPPDALLKFLEDL